MASSKPPFKDGLDVSLSDIVAAAAGDEQAIRQIRDASLRYVLEWHSADIPRDECDEIASTALLIARTMIREGRHAAAVRLALRRALDRWIERVQRQRASIVVDTIQEMLPLALDALADHHHDLIVKMYRLDEGGLKPRGIEMPRFASGKTAAAALRSARIKFSQEIEHLITQEMTRRGSSDSLAVALQFVQGFFPSAEFTWARDRKEPNLCTVVDISPHVLALLREDPRRIQELSPEAFEILIAERLDRIGYDVQRTGSSNAKDGGIDIIAVPKVRTVGAFLLAAQVKHHRGSQRTGRAAVDRMLALDQWFHLGLLVTNTDFTSHAKWAAESPRGKVFLQLRNFEDLSRWIVDDFRSERDWRELPREIEIAPGVRIVVPQPALPLPPGVRRPRKS